MTYALFCKMARAIKMTNELGEEFFFSGYLLNYIDEGSKESIVGDKIKISPELPERIYVSFYEGKETENDNFLC